MNPFGFATVFGTILGLKIQCGKCKHLQDKKKYGVLVRKCEQCGASLYPGKDGEGEEEENE